MIAKVVCGVVLGVGLAAAASAAPPRTIDQRQHQQLLRIRDGWRNGSLTRAERYRLVTEQRTIRLEERRYRRGGLTRWERRDLQRDLNRASRHIYRETHDRQRR